MSTNCYSTRVNPARLGAFLLEESKQLDAALTNKTFGQAQAELANWLPVAMSFEDGDPAAKLLELPL